MQDLKHVIAKNISDLRKENKMTQLDLAEKLNYSDKAVSKWERGESIPDIAVLLEISRLFDVTLDYLVSEDHEITPVMTEEEAKLKEATRKIVNKNRTAVTGISMQAVWLVATIVFISLSLFGVEGSGKWLVFAYAVPTTMIVWLVFNSLWFNRRRNYLIISILMWSLLAAIYFTGLVLGENIFYVNLLGLPGQAIIVLWSIIGKKPQKTK